MTQQSEGGDNAQDAHDQQAHKPPAQISGALANTADRDGGKQKAGTQQEPSDNVNARNCVGSLKRFLDAVNWPAVNAILTLIFAGSLVVFTFRQAFYVNRQWDAMVEQNKIMIEQMKQTDTIVRLSKAQLKPYLGIESYQLTLPEKSVDSCTLSLEIVNGGATATRLTEVVINSKFFPAVTSASAIREQFLSDMHQMIQVHDHVESIDIDVPPGKRIKLGPYKFNSFSATEDRQIKDDAWRYCVCITIPHDTIFDIADCYTVILSVRGGERRADLIGSFERKLPGADAASQ